MRSPTSRKLALKRAGRCFICLRRGHVSTNCRSGLKCSHCNNRHHTSICLSHKPEPRPLQRESSNTGLNPDSAEYHRSRTAPAENPTTLLVENQGVILLQTAQAVVFNTAHPTMRMKIRVVLDTGSQKSYATLGVMTSLGLSPKSRRSMSIATFGSVGQNCHLVTIGMEMEEGPPQSLDVFIVPTICEPLSNNGRSYVIEEFSHLQHLELSDPIDGSPKEIDVLVGSDYYWTLVTGRMPTAVHTRLGWVLSGPTTLFDGCENPATLVYTYSCNECFRERLRAFWEIESLGVCETTPNGAKVEPGEEITFRDGRYEVTLPWKSSLPNLPDNYHLSRRRLTGLLQRLRRTPNVMKEYDCIIKSQLEQGIVEMVETPQCLNGERVHYLPHHAVIRQDIQKLESCMMLQPRRTGYHSMIVYIQVPNLGRTYLISS